MKEEALKTEKKRFKLGEKWKQKWSRKKAAMSGAAAAGLIAVSALAIAPTTAAWNDSESVGAEVSSGEFDLQISTDGGSTWQSQNGSTVSMNIPITGNRWGPGDSATGSQLRLRMSPGTTHDGVIQFNDCSTASGSSVRVVGSGGAASHFNWRMRTYATQGVTDFTTVGLNNCSPGNLSATNGRLVLDSNNQNGYQVDIGATGRSTLPQNSSGNLTVTFTAESVPNS